MAAPRVPTNVLDARGTFKKHRDRERARAGEPRALAALGPVPGHLSEAERVCWAELVGIAPAGVLWAPDRVILEVLARLVAEMRETGREFSPAKLAHLRAALGLLGLTPADRSRVAAAVPAPMSEVDAALGPR